MGCLTHPWKKYWLENGFAFGALNRPRYLFMYLDNRNILRFSPVMIHLRLKDLGGS
jgi:hypothetical protein